MSFFVYMKYYKYVAERGDWDDPLFTHSYDAYQAGDVEYAAIGYLQAAERGIEVGQSNFAWILDRGMFFSVGGQFSIDMLRTVVC